jgi:chorismate--pyruvate lyase
MMVRRHAPWALWPWLVLPASLTAALRRAYGRSDTPQVLLLGSGRGVARQDERRHLRLQRGERVFWREVLLHGGDAGRPALWARTTVPLHGLRQGLLPLTRQGTRPIGDLLFRHRRLRRSAIVIERRRRQQAWSWARRSILQRGPSQALIEEHFSHHLPAWHGRGRR